MRALVFGFANAADQGTGASGDGVGDTEHGRGINRVRVPPADRSGVGSGAIFGGRKERAASSGSIV